MPLGHKQLYTQQLISNLPNDLFVFGDNMSRTGFGGQAKAVRGFFNAIGIPTKWAPSNMTASYFSDKDYAFVAPVIYGDFRKVELYLGQEKRVWLPADGIGTGLADLRNKAPSILQLINSEITRLRKMYGE